MTNEEEIEDLIVAIGKLCSGHRARVVLTALTYILADVCVASNVGMNKFLEEVVANLHEAINDIQEEEHGSSTHH